MNMISIHIFRDIYYHFQIKRTCVATMYTANVIWSWKERIGSKHEAIFKGKFSKSCTKIFLLIAANRRVIRRQFLTISS